MRASAQTAAYQSTFYHPHFLQKRPDLCHNVCRKRRRNEPGATSATAKAKAAATAAAVAAAAAAAGGEGSDAKMGSVGSLDRGGDSGGSGVGVVAKTGDAMAFLQPPHSRRRRRHNSYADDAVNEDGGGDGAGGEPPARQRRRRRHPSDHSNGSSHAAAAAEVLSPAHGCHTGAGASALSAAAFASLHNQMQSQTTMTTYLKEQLMLAELWRVHTMRRISAAQTSVQRQMGIVQALVAKKAAQQATAAAAASAGNTSATQNRGDQEDSAGGTSGSGDGSEAGEDSEDMSADMSAALAHAALQMTERELGDIAADKGSGGVGGMPCALLDHDYMGDALRGIYRRATHAGLL